MAWGGNETSGLWFATGARSSLSAGLNLPSLPDGWAYEGWVETADGQISIGAFQQMDDHDFLSSLFSARYTPHFLEKTLSKIHPKDSLFL